MRALFLAAIALPFVLLASSAPAAWPGSGQAYLGTSGPPSSCPDNDGSSGADAGTPNYPTLLTGGNPGGTTYAATINGAHGLGCLVAGVDYVVGTPPGATFSDPRSATLPTGCAYDGSKFVHCSGGPGTVSGFDFTLGAPTLLTTSGTWTVNGNKFSFGANCTDPVINASGSLTLTKNFIDGTAGFGCSLSMGFGTFVNVNIAANGFFTAEYNYFLKVAQDAYDMNLPSSGSETVTIKYNLGYEQGTTGHPDFIQFCGGGAGIVTPTIEHNTWFSYLFSGISQGVQPFHIEAQTCSGLGHIANSVTAFNTIMAQGACNHGTNYPVGCSINFNIACKRDDTSTNLNFLAYGNYVDWSGGIAPLDNQGCTSATWGTPFANYDMIAGTTLTTSP